jgi:hypothetical protein
MKPNAVEFHFTPQQRTRAADEGLRRHIWALQHRSKSHNWAGHETSLQMHMIGAAGELAVAYYTGLEDYLYLDLVPVKYGNDLPGIDAKTRSRHSYDLCIHADEPAHKLYWLVTIENKRTFIQGWYRGVDCRQDRWLRGRDSVQPCYFVPQGAIHDPQSWTGEEIRHLLQRTA